MYLNNPEYQLALECGKYRFYTPVNIADYHRSREAECRFQNIYSNAGATAEYLREICQAGLKMIENDPKSETLRQNTISIFNQIIYRTQNPIDSLCSIRMGAILLLLEYEDQSEPVDVKSSWTDKKIQLAMDIPEVYSFFLSLGVNNTEAYLSRLDTLRNGNYFQERADIIRSLSPLIKE
jgi:hypothetical protein